ncbi:hypothetical protein MCOR24_005602 [Pyricularia oryzae]|nr:hypothetical protein MCOR24_005602 [Pyricularia oryzae]KAI6573846.1 hypothetical protein MCOR09_002598 [Pyricularia oryzae]
MRAFITICLFVGLAVAGVDPPATDKPSTGNRCCGQGTTDPNNFCKRSHLDASCCSSFASDRPKARKGAQGGCDENPGFPIGRVVKEALSFGSGCESNGRKGFVGCA